MTYRLLVLSSCSLLLLDHIDVLLDFGRLVLVLQTERLEVYQPGPTQTSSLDLYRPYRPWVL
jgi:hypothetical protein